MTLLPAGFRLLKEAVGSDSFFGRAAPNCFMTDNCAPERNALKSIWPTARQYLCAFHILQQVWRWLLDSRHGVKKGERQQLLGVVKSLLYATSPEKLLNIWEAFCGNILAEDNAAFIK